MNHQEQIRQIDGAWLHTVKREVKIINGKRGFHLRVDGFWIHSGFGGAFGIKAIRNKIGIPYGATEWVSVEAIRTFWNKYREIIVTSTERTYRSVWGQLELIPTQYA